MEEKTSEKIYLEGSIKFKRGLRSSWSYTFTSIYYQVICVYKDRTKETELHRFNPSNSWVTASANGETGLFFLNIYLDSKLYLFESGSHDLLLQWLSALTKAGWKTPALHTSPSKTKLIPKYSNTLPHEKSENNLNTFTERCIGMERSFSMPSLVLSKSKEPKLLSVNERLEYDRQACANLYDNGVKSKLMLKKSISESGYCSKESLLLVDNERLLGRPRKISKQETINIPASDRTISMTSDRTPQDATFIDVDEKEKTASSITRDHMGGYKLDYDNNFVDVCKEDDKDNVLADIEDPDATPKLEKKPSMSQLILNLKSKFGSTSSRKKGKKGSSKRIARNDIYSGRLLWNPNGQWKDKWFYYQDGHLQGFKEVGFKPADVSINIKECTLTTYTGDEMIKRLNLFKLTTISNVSHTFAAWNEEEYDAWFECLAYSVLKQELIQGVNMEVKAQTTDTEETFIIPYERALSNQDSQKTSTSSENSTTRVDSIDSGNDGDESGLDSSLTTMQYKMKKANGGVEQPNILRSLMESKRKSKTPTEEEQKHLSFRNLKLDLNNDPKKRYSAEVVGTKVSPSFEITPSLDDVTKLGVLKRPARPTSLNSQQRWSYHGSKKDLHKLLAINERLQIPKKQQTIHLKTKSEELISASIDHRQSRSLDSPLSYRPSSADSVLANTPGSNDNPVFPNTWDSYRSYKKSLSEDDISDSCSMQSTGSIPMTDDRKQEDIEDSLREETFLRKRRNSLTLERGEICTQIIVLQERPKKSNKNTIPSAVPATTANNKNEKIAKLESRLEHIDSQIEIIEKKISLRFNPVYKISKIVKRNNPIMNKLRGKSKPIDNTNSMSVESLTSSGSRDSRDGQDLELHKNEYSIPENFVPAPRGKYYSEGSDSTIDVGKTSPKLTGLEELFLTAEKLEQSKGQKNSILHQPLSTSDKWRSKSLGSMDLVNSRSKDFSSQPKYDQISSVDNQSTAECEKVIEDFERFSAYLSSQMEIKGNIIQV